jgi:Domain of unknown function (DUF929)
VARGAAVALDGGIPAGHFASLLVFASLLALSPSVLSGFQGPKLMHSGSSAALPKPRVTERCCSTRIRAERPRDQAALTASGKPEVLYTGAGFCPYCAAVRWPLIVALSRFGTFSGLAPARSAITNGAGQRVHPAVRAPQPRRGK